MAKDNVYSGDFSSWDDVQKEFRTDEPEPTEVYEAAYDNGCYEGDAEVFYRKGSNTYYHVTGSHCSCYGLEGQFDPTEFKGKKLFKEYLDRIKRPDIKEKL